MVEHVGMIATEIYRATWEFGIEGKLGAQVNFTGASGMWEETQDNINAHFGNLTAQIRDIFNVIKDIARGNLSKKVTVDAKRDMMDIKNAVNFTVDILQNIAMEVVRVSLDAGRDGGLGRRADVSDTTGTWKEMLDSLNTMADCLTIQVRSITEVTTAISRGDLSKTLDIQCRGEIQELQVAINGMVKQLRTFSDEVIRVSREIGTEGHLGICAEVTSAKGTWKELTENVNIMASHLTTQVRSVAVVTRAVTTGDLSMTIDTEGQGEMKDLRTAVNSMVEQLRAVVIEITRVTREVGVEGRLEGQAVVKDVGGSWKELIDNINMMISNLARQGQSIADVTRATT
ncbi:hypothetical protein BGX31_004244, partial [Mortierella sp. GBA43]